MSCDYAHFDGAYVLGALVASERAEYERHLAECDDCARAVREIAGLPGLVTRVPPEVLEAPDAEEPAPATLLPALVSRVEQSRRRTTVLALAVAAVLVLVLGAAGILAVTLGSGEDGGDAAGPAPSVPSEQMESLVGGSVTGWVALAEREWGTQVELTCTYGDASSGKWRSYTVVVRTVDGEAERLGSWRAEPGRQARVVLSTAVDRDDIAAVLVQTLDGVSVLRLTP